MPSLGDFPTASTLQFNTVSLSILPSLPAPFIYCHWFHFLINVHTNCAFEIWGFQSVENWNLSSGLWFCNLICGCQCFRGTCCLCLQGGSDCNIHSVVTQEITIWIVDSESLTSGYYTADVLKNIFFNVQFWEFTLHT